MTGTLRVRFLVPDVGRTGGDGGIRGQEMIDGKDRT